MATQKLLYPILGIITLGLIAGCDDEPLKINYELGIFPDFGNSD